MMKLAFLAFVLGAAACGGVTVLENNLNAPPHALSPRDPATVDLYTAGPPPRPRVDVSVIRAQASIADNDERIVAMRKRAAELGCDGLVLAGTDSGWVGTCIVYTTPAN